MTTATESEGNLEMLTVGEKLWNGATVTPDLARAYNRVQAKIAQYRAAGLPVPENILNGAHNLIASAGGK